MGQDMPLLCDPCYFRIMIVAIKREDTMETQQYLSRVPLAQPQLTPHQRIEAADRIAMLSERGSPVLPLFPGLSGFFYSYQTSKPTFCGEQGSQPAHVT